MAVTKRVDTDMERLERAVAELENRAVYRQDGSFAGLRSPLRPGALGGAALTVVLAVVMLLFGGTLVGQAQYPLSQRLLAYDIVVGFLSLVVGLVLLLVGRWQVRLRPAARVLLQTAFATWLAAIDLGILSGLLPLHLKGFL